MLLWSFFCCCRKNSRQKHLKEGRVCFGSRIERTACHGEEVEAVGGCMGGQPVTSRPQSGSQAINAHAQLPSSSLFSPGPKPMGQCHPHWAGCPTSKSTVTTPPHSVPGALPVGRFQSLSNWGPTQTITCPCSCLILLPNSGDPYQPNGQAVCKSCQMFIFFLAAVICGHAGCHFTHLISRTVPAFSIFTCLSCLE